jgi:membrane protease YdiL (CAAX protease family)
MTLKFKSSIPALLVPTAFKVLFVIMATMPFALSAQHGRMVGSFIGVAMAFGLVYLAIKKENTSFRTYQLFIDKGTYKRFLWGFLLSVLVAGAMILSHALYSGLQFTPSFGNLNGFLLMSLFLIPFAFMEELVFRSFALTKLNQTYNIWVAQIITALLFALYHVVGANGQSLSSALIGPGIWSFIFVALALRSNGISMPTGFHYGLNLVLASIGDKTWIPGLWVVDFKEAPTKAALQAHETFGIALHSLLLVIGIVATFYLSRHMSKAKKQTS